MGDGRGGLSRHQCPCEDSRGYTRLCRGTVTGDRGNGALAGGDGDEVGPAVSGLSEVDVAVVLVKDHVCGTEEGVSQDCLFCSMLAGSG